MFDVQIAAGLTGHDFPISLQKLVNVTLGVRLRKSRTLTDWRRRPLSAEQVKYAAEDVGYLLAVRKLLHRQLSKRKRLSGRRRSLPASSVLLSTISRRRVGSDG